MKSSPIRWSGYLLITVNGLKKYPDRSHMWKPTAKAVVNKPAVGPDEIAVKISVEIPSSIFTRPQLEAHITIPDGVMPPAVVNLEVMDNVADLIQRSTGFDVRLVAAEPDKK